MHQLGKQLCVVLCVQVLEIEGISPTSIKVSWRLQDPEDVQRVDGFYILYREAASASGFTSLTVLHAAATSYNVNRLTPHTLYEFLVIPFQRGACGLPSPLRTAETQEIRPTFAPAHVGWSQVPGGAVNLTWSVLPKEKFHGVPQGYRVSSLLQLLDVIQPVIASLQLVSYFSMCTP